jgi:transcriptional regulator with XRE-family HTH domain
VEAHLVDRHVGVRIRARRRQLGISQQLLADTIGCTFQQVQKYENAKNRVSSSRLFEIARVLKVNPSYFFDGLPMSDLEPGEPPPVFGPEEVEIASLFMRIRNPTRRKVLELTRTLAAET